MLTISINVNYGLVTHCGLCKCQYIDNIFNGYWECYDMMSYNDDYSFEYKKRFNKGNICECISDILLPVKFE